MSVRLITAGAAFLVLATVSGAAAQSQTARPPGAAPQSQPARPFSERDATRQVQGFNIVLVLGETQPSTRVEATQDLPAGAQKALNDMREFLPYKHYRVLDAQWTSCCAGVSSVLAGQLRGIAAGPSGGQFFDRQYGFQLTVNSSSQGLSVRFALADKVDATRREPADTDRQREAALQRADIRDQLLTLEAQLAEAKKKVDAGLLPAVDLRPMQDKINSMKRQYEAVMRSTEGQQDGPRGGIIDSSFIMQPGETVVVGTSRLGGDKAIIALVTAAKKTEK